MDITIAYKSHTYKLFLDTDETTAEVRVYWNVDGSRVHSTWDGLPSQVMVDALCEFANQ